MKMNKYQEALKRLEGMVLTSPFKNDGARFCVCREQIEFVEVDH